MFVSLISLHPDDWLDALGLAFLIEIKNAVHVAVVGHAESRLTVRRRTGNEFV
jgi:hypothetical protein